MVEAPCCDKAAEAETVGVAAKPPATEPVTEPKGLEGDAVEAAARPPVVEVVCNDISP